MKFDGFADFFASLLASLNGGAVPGNDSVQEVVHLDPPDLRPEAVDRRGCSCRRADLEGEAGGGLVVILGLLAVPDICRDVAVLEIPLLLGPLTREGPEG